jgi:hypothetical protein
MALQVFVFLLVVFLLSLALLWRLDWSLFGLPPREEGSSAPGSPVCSSLAPQMTAPPVVSLPLPRQVEGQHLRLCGPGARSKAGEELYWLLGIPVPTGCATSFISSVSWHESILHCSHLSISRGISAL